MTPAELEHELRQMVAKEIRCSVMIWGPPGVGKSSIVAQIAADGGIGLVDLRLSQLAPTDLRGLPVAEDGRSTWYPPNFLPQDGKGVLFLDEINMAPPAMQGVAQQLILDRRIGDYVVPEGWYVWAAGNRKIDRAAVFDMPSALANRFLHYEVEPEITAFKDWALRSELSEEIIGFLLFRPNLLHKYKPNQLAWPSPRSWQMADQLHKADLTTAPAVGDAVAGEFEAYCKVVKKIPDLERILSGKSKVKFPAEASARYAVVLGLATRAKTPAKVKHALKWLREKAGGEWVQLFVSDVFTLYRERQQLGPLLKELNSDTELKKMARELRDVMLS